MNIIIRKAEEEDFPTIASLIKEHASYNKDTEKVTNSLEQMRNEKNFFECLVAETEDKEVVGFAIYFFAYYTYVGKSLYLDDVYVKEQFRGQNIGTQLMQKIIEEAQKENCKRVRWQTGKWNKPAIEFYEKYGAKITDETLNCNFDESGLKDFKI